MTDLHPDIRWLPVSQHIFYRIAALAWRCLLDCTLAASLLVWSLLSGLWQTVYSWLSCPPIVSWGELSVPRAHSSTGQCWAFSIVRPSIWNRLPLEVCLNTTAIYKLLKSSLLLWLGWECLWVGLLKGARLNSFNEWVNECGICYLLFHALKFEISFALLKLILSFGIMTVLDNHVCVIASEHARHDILQL